MTEHWFYHLESAPIEAVLPNLLEKSIEKGWRVLVKTDDEGLSYFDDFLWSYRDDSFLPHGRDDEPQADQNPIILSTNGSGAQGADVVFITDGSDMENLDGVQRCIFLINGRSEQAVNEARARWTRLKKFEADMSYWQQTDRGGWEKKA